MKQPANFGTTLLKAVGVMVVLGAVAHAGMPYLPLIGPPPLRVQAAESPREPVVLFEAPASPAPVAKAESNPPPVVVKESVSTGAASNAVAVTAVSAPVLNPPPEEPMSGPAASSVFVLPTPDLMGFTPQMLATYFHPVPFGTNAVLAGPFHVSFLPPLPPANSSHAEYIVK